MYSGIPSQLKGIFKSIQADLYTVEFWNDMKERVKQGEIVNMFPYELSKQLRNRYQKI